MEMTNRRRRMGFSAISPERQKEIASMGGKAAHRKGTAHQWGPEEAAEAGRKGGLARARNRGVQAVTGR